MTKKSILYLILMALCTSTITLVFGVNDIPILLAAVAGYVFGRLIEKDLANEKGKTVSVSSEGRES